MRDAIGSFPQKKNTDKQLDAINSLERMVAAALTAYSALDSQLHITDRELELKKISDEELKLREQDKLMKDKGRVIAYSVYVGSVIGLKTLEDKAMVDITDNSRVISFNFRRPLYDAIGDSLRGLYLMLLQNKEQIKNTDEDKMMTILSSFYKTMINSAEIYKDQFLALARKEDLTTKFKIDEITFDGYSYSSFKIMRPAELMDSAKLDYVIGFDKVKEMAREMIGNLGGLRKKNNEWINPRLPFSHSAFVVSKPGEGKTFLAHATANEFLEFCSKRDIPARVIILRPTDYGTAYQFESAKNLQRWIDDEIVGWNGAVMVYTPDFDTYLVSRESPHTTNEQKQVQNIMFGIFDGTLGKKNGKWFWWADANFLPEDAAAYSRLKENMWEGEGVKSGEGVVKLFRDIKLRDYKDYISSITEKQWEEFGKLCYEEYGMNGRAVDHISTNAIKRIRPMRSELPEKYYDPDTTLEECLEMERKHSKPLSYEDIRGIAGHYFKEEKDVMDRQRQEEHKSNVEYILRNRGAQADADAIMGLSSIPGEEPRGFYERMKQKLGKGKKKDG